MPPLREDEGLGRRGPVRKAADGLLVDLDAEAGSRGYLDMTVPGLDGTGEEGHFVLARGELDRNGSAPGRRHVKGRREPRAEIEGVWRDRQVGGLRERRDLPELGHPAHLGDARLENVAGPSLDDLPEAVERRLVLAERDRRPGARGDPREPRVVFRGPDGLLEPVKAVRLERS